MDATRKTAHVDGSGVMWRKARRGRYGWVWGQLACVFAVLGAGCGETVADPEPPMGTANQRPTAAFTVDVTAGAAPLQVAFDASASSDPDGTIDAYAWSFGDGATGTGVTTTHTYQTPGQYTPVLTVTDDRGATAEAAGDRTSVSSPPGNGINEVSGSVWHDADGDGQRDAGEEPIPEFPVFVDDDGNGQRGANELVAFTDQAGAYRFAGLDGGRSYTITQELSVGWTNTAPGVPPGPVPERATTDVDGGAIGISAIIGGGQADPGEFPFQVALVTSDTRFQFCGGTFIARSWVMTAAHCVDGGVQPADIQVLAGTHDLESGGGQLLDVNRILIHPAFSSTAFVDHDLALLELVGEFMFARIELLTPDRVKLSDPGTLATAIGWGFTTINGSPSSTLKELTSEIITNTECRTLLQNNVLDVTICAGTSGSSSAVCNGDSGGPLMVPFRDRWLQVGIVSFGANLCFQPSAFARVSALVGFVESNVPVEPSGSVVVDWSGGGTTAVVDFGNFR